MTTDPITAEAERILQIAADDLTQIRPGECLVCYVDRMVHDVGCDCTLRFARWYRDHRAPRSVALERRLGSVGAYCDCEILWNGWVVHDRFWTPAREVEEDGIVVCCDPEPPHPSPPCATVRRGSIRPCTNWVRL